MQKAVLLYLFSWLAIAAIAATTVFIALRGTLASEWLWIFRTMAEYFYAWAVVVLLVYWLQNRFGRGRTALPVQVLLQLALLGIVLLAMPLLIQTENWRAWMYGERAAGFQSLNVLMFALALIGSKTYDYYREAKAQDARLFAAELRRVELEKTAESARMDALRAQINPHFLFNTLNSVAALIESSSNQEAYDVVARLAELLRHSFDYSRDKLVTLREELRFLDAYLGIEMVRFGPRLRVRQSVPEACLGLEVPSFCLQPLVENAIKHAVARTSDTVTIEIGVNCGANCLVLSVADDGPGITQPARFGVGLGNVSSRIANLYGSDASLVLRPGDGGGATATLRIPLQRSSTVITSPADHDQLRTHAKPAGAPIGPAASHRQSFGTARKSEVGHTP